MRGTARELQAGERKPANLQTWHPARAPFQGTDGDQCFKERRVCVNKESVSISSRASGLCQTAPVAQMLWPVPRRAQGAGARRSHMGGCFDPPPRHCMVWAHAKERRLIHGREIASGHSWVWLQIKRQKAGGQEEGEKNVLPMVVLMGWWVATSPTLQREGAASQGHNLTAQIFRQWGPGLPRGSGRQLSLRSRKFCHTSKVVRYNRGAGTPRVLRGW